MIDFFKYYSPKDFKESMVQIALGFFFLISSAAGLSVNKPNKNLFLVKRKKNSDEAGPLGDLGLMARVLIAQYLR